MRQARMNPGGSAAINAGAMMYRSDSVLVPRFLLDLAVDSSFCFVSPSSSRFIEE
jgi:hypothetical protein